MNLPKTQTNIPVFKPESLLADDIGIFRLTHAGYFVTTKKTKIIMDPLLENDWTDFLTLSPTISLNNSTLMKLKIDAIIISHFHGDHFHLKSLARFDRDTLIVYPKGCQTIKNIITVMNFKKLLEIDTYQFLKVGDIEIGATPSRADFPEMGIHFRKGKTKLLNLVDSAIDSNVIKTIITKKGIPTVSFVFYQPLQEMALRNGESLKVFPKKKYAQLQEIVTPMKGSYIVPSSCSWGYKDNNELNHWMFPVTEEKFAVDIAKTNPSVKPLILGVGHGLVLNNGKVKSISRLSWIKKKSDVKKSTGPIILKDLGQFKIDHRKKKTLELIIQLLIPKIEAECPKPIKAQKINYEFLRPKQKPFYVQLQLNKLGSTAVILDKKPKAVFSQFTSTAFITALTTGMSGYSLVATGQYIRLAKTNDLTIKDLLLESIIDSLDRMYLLKAAFKLNKKVICK